MRFGPFDFAQGTIIMPLRLFNTLTRKKEVFRPIKNKKVGLYCCGPTVYWFAHLGNLRTYIFEDILRRVLEYNGYGVKHVMNFTDVGHLTSDQDVGEDKMELGAKREGKTVQEIADFYIAAFKRDCRLLNIKEPTLYVRATDHIEEQIELVKILERKSFTYKTRDGIYFNTAKLKDYGRLARLDLAGLKPGARLGYVPDKKNPTDFALWKFSPAGLKRQQEWSSPWGVGFPGWHLECSAMSQKYLSAQFDIHGGGVDHINVHHTNEIAQSQAAYGKIPARYWLHGEFLMIDGGKMAKSAENLLTAETVFKTFHPLAYRYLILGAHYRSKLNLTWKSLTAAQVTLKKLYQLMIELDVQRRCSGWSTKLWCSQWGLTGKTTQNMLKKIRKCEEEFLEAVNNDLDTPQALTALWQFIQDQTIPLAAKRKTILKFDRALGLDLDKIRYIRPPACVKKLAQEREHLRQQKNWLKADVLRAQIEQEGWLVEDTAAGPKLKIKI